jgi:hypothetical protein
MKREKCKLEKWMERYLKAEVVGYSKTQKSRYYKFNTRIIRISDHISNNSDGDISIILDSHDTTHFIVHAVRTGEISVLTYSEVRQLIRSIKLLPAFMIVANSTEGGNTLPKDVCTEAVDKVDLKNVNQYVLGVHIGKFKPGQQNAIRCMAAKLKP